MGHGNNFVIDFHVLFEYAKLVNFELGVQITNRSGNT